MSDLVSNINIKKWVQKLKKNVNKINEWWKNKVKGGVMMCEKCKTKFTYIQANSIHPYYILMILKHLYAILNYANIFKEK